MDFSEEQKMNSQLMLILFMTIALVTSIGSGMGIFETYQKTGSVAEIIWLPFIMMTVMGLIYYMVFQSTLETRSDNEATIARETKTIAANIHRLGI